MSNSKQQSNVDPEDDYDIEDEDEQMMMMQQMQIGANSALLKHPQQSKNNKQETNKQKQYEDDDEDFEEKYVDNSIDDDSDMEDESDMDNNINAEQKIQELIQAINADPYDFQKYQQLIELYKSNGYLEELGEARERVHQMYCLPVHMWLEWIVDEKSLLTQDESPQKILQLYETALKDYKYYKISKKYCRLLIQLYEIQQGNVSVQQVRDGFERVLQIYALDVNRSVKFWDPYLTFEKEQYDQLQAQLNQLQTTTSEDKQVKLLEEELSKQESRIRSIYRRRVIFPTMDMFVIWGEYEQWETDPDELQRNKERYLQAKERINDVVNFEENFQNAYQVLEDKLDIEPMVQLLTKDLEVLAQDNFNYIMLYFERILSEYTLNLDLWKIYIDYTDEKCKKKELKQEIYEKAVKNCPQEYEFWLGYLRELEKNEVTEDQIISVANQALTNGSFEISIQFQYEIWKALCEYQVRQLIIIPGVKPNLENEAIMERVSKIRATYQDSIDNLKEENKGDQLLFFFTDKLTLGWAEVEAYKIQDKKQVQDLMEDYVKKNGHQIMSWTNYLKLMREFPDHEKTLRGLFKRGLQIVKDNKVLIGELWLEWEKKFSAIQFVDQCIKHLKKLNIYSQIGKPQKPQHISQQLNSRQQAYQQQEEDQDNFKRQDLNKRPQQETQQKRQRTDQQPDQKYRKQHEDNHDNDQKSQQHQKKTKNTLYLQKLSDQAEEEDIQALFDRVVPDVQINAIRLIRDDKGNKRGFAFVDVETKEMAEKSLKLSNYNLKGNMIQVRIYKPPSDNEKEEFTVYVSNLPKTCTEQKLQEHFKQVGAIDEIRLIRDSNNIIRGYAYVQFLEKESVQKAIDQLNKSILEQRTITVDKTKSKKEVKEQIGHSVVIKNLDYNIYEDQIKNYLEQHFGEVKKLTLSKDQHGRSKGLAFVEFVDEPSMQKAVDQKEIHGLGKRFGVIMKSMRQITQPKQNEDQKHHYQHKDKMQQQQQQLQKKREAKQERKTLLSSMINEIKNETKQAIQQDQQQQQPGNVESVSQTPLSQQKQVDQQHSTNNASVNAQISNQDKEVDTKIEIQVPSQQKAQVDTTATMSNADFKKMLFSKKR